MIKKDLLIIGSGLAGAIAALELAQKGASVLLVSSGKTGRESASQMAQGGIIYEGDADGSALLYEDILKAGGGLCDPCAVEQLVSSGPRLVKELLIDKYQVLFARDNAGRLLFAKEGAHSLSRILYHYDQTGKAIMQTLFAAILKEPLIQFVPNHTAIDLVISQASCQGAYIMSNPMKESFVCLAQETILATGGVGELFLHTTNPEGARGDGLAMAARAGARLKHLEYVQFHPTVFYQPGRSSFLLSEAMRGEGGELLSWDKKPFMHRYDLQGSLAGRDLVARSMYGEMVEHRLDHLWLDLSFCDASWLKKRFPFIDAQLLSQGVDMTKEPIPVVPAAHYSCGGIEVDGVGRTNIAHLRAIGEVACSGVHGANRLASASLLEALVWAKRSADDIALALPSRAPFSFQEESLSRQKEEIEASFVDKTWQIIKETMWNSVGIVRKEETLHQAVRRLERVQSEVEGAYKKFKLTPELLGVRNAALTALLIAKAAYQNKKSLGCHYIDQFEV